MTEKDDFYDRLLRVDSFADLTNPTLYTALPDDWVIGTADIVNSTSLVAAGHYKTVNLVGAAVVSAMMNARDGAAFPFVFGGDGASFAVSGRGADLACTTLQRVARWALTEFDIGMRVALIPLTDIRAAGADVRVARFQASGGVDYAMFTGLGLSWADDHMKDGTYQIDLAPEGELPDLTGLSCRWSHMPARNGTILTVLIAPQANAPTDQVMQVYDRVIALAQGLERGGHPAPPEGPGSDWPPKGAQLEAHAAHATGSLGRAKAKALFESFAAWALIRTGITLGGFDARRYARIVGDNADFRKLDDTLKMTLDCDTATRTEIQNCLAQAASGGLVRYGLATQNEAMMTCIVPSIMTDDHVHFIDGAAGGYTLAATRMKQSAKI